MSRATASAFNWTAVIRQARTTKPVHGSTPKEKFLQSSPPGLLIPDDGCARTFWHNVRCEEPRPQPTRLVIKGWTWQHLNPRRRRRGRVRLEDLSRRARAKPLILLLHSETVPANKAGRAVVRRLGERRTKR